MCMSVRCVVVCGSCFVVVCLLSYNICVGVWFCLCGCVVCLRLGGWVRSVCC